MKVGPEESENERRIVLTDISSALSAQPYEAKSVVPWYCVDGRLLTLQSAYIMVQLKERKNTNRMAQCLSENWIQVSQEVPLVCNYVVLKQQSYASLKAAVYLFIKWLAKRKPKSKLTIVYCVKVFI